ncbi:kinesin-like protein KIF18B isoform X2 [Eublepharis macularius]|uniref:Kinesin-like protein n=1 Tax=Eublepharis macularius TaxID=481883 RepID=A0AA97LD66_EUBMA|nr:kinesin-like protein KIF18B isoform X2 [Eublepharis macularius]
MVPVPPAEEGNVSVVVRVRPQTSREKEGNRQSVVQVVSDCLLVFDPEEPSLLGVLAGFQGHDSAPRHKGKDLKFVFDRVFGESATQVEVFENTTKGILEGVLNGYNCSVFAYGATGAGKTHTMLGSEKDPGIMYLTMAELYKKIEAKKGQKQWEVLISYQEVYNEQIHDLLEPKGPLPVREDPEKGVVVPGLSFHQPKTAEQLLEMLARGNQNRTQHPTDINATSSRSHAVFQIYVKQHNNVAGITQDLRVAKMSLIDLAGSERASIANTKGARLREGANINRSLLALINVINALADAKSKKPHIPYRDSKLTRLLKDSIGGNCRTIMIAAVSPSMLSYEDTYNTLKYANRAKEIKLLMKSNVLTLDCHISQYAAICEQLKAEVADLRGRLQAYEEKGLPVNPHGPAQDSRPKQEELVRIKETCLGHKGDGEMDAESKQLKLGGGPSCLGENSLKQESQEKPSYSSIESSNPVKQEENVGIGQQKMERNQLERLITAIFSIARKQYAVLKAAKLLTPDMITEFEELDLLVPRESGEAPKAPTAEKKQVEPCAIPEVALPLEVPQLVNQAEHATPAGISGFPPALLEISPTLSNVFKTPRLPAKRRKSARSTTPAERNTPSVPKGRAKRRRKASVPPQQENSPKKWAIPAGMDCTSTPIADTAKSHQTHLHIPQPCPLTVTKGRVPLASSVAQNCATPLPPCGLNATFDLGENPCPASAPEFPAWESIQQFPNPQGVPLIPRASMPVFTMKGSSIPRSSSLASRTSVQKRRHAAGSASHLLGAPRSRIARLQQRSVQASQAVKAPAGHPSCRFMWK